MLATPPASRSFLVIGGVLIGVASIEALDANDTNKVLVDNVALYIPLHVLDA